MRADANERSAGKASSFAAAVQMSANRSWATKTLASESSTM